MSKPTGYIIYEGKSQINGEPIVGIVTLKSNNVKTGNMASLWILHKDIAPTKASKSGDDEAVCGDCPMRHHLGGACYVTLFQAPLQVFKSYKKGNYPIAESMDIFKDMKVRFGAYGDPYALPIEVLVKLKAVIANNTSYTHQWKQGDNELLKTMSMASADSIEEAKEAHSQGWRTFRVTHKPDVLLDNEIICPNYTKGVQCIDCKLCSGASNAKSIVIPVHGAKSKKFIE